MSFSKFVQVSDVRQMNTFQQMMPTMKQSQT